MDYKILDLEREAQQSPMDERTTADLTRAYIRSGRLGEAEKYLDNTTFSVNPYLTPNSELVRWAYMQLARKYSDAGQYAKAERIAGLMIKYDHDLLGEFLELSRLSPEEKKEASRVIERCQEDGLNLYFSTQAGTIQLLFNRPRISRRRMTNSMKEFYSITSFRDEAVLMPDDS